MKRTALVEGGLQLFECSQRELVSRIEAQRPLELLGGVPKLT